MPRIILGAATLSMALVAGTAAQAACQDDVASLEERLAAVEAAGARSDPVEVETSSGEVTVEAEESGAEPGESWFGSPPSIEGANRHLDSARQAAEEGDEATCAEHAAQAARILDALEG